MKGRHTAAFIGLAAMLAVTPACVVGPKYVKPTAPVAGSFKEPVPANFKEAEGWKQGEPKDDMHKGKWWEIFKDPNLNAFEEQIDIGNQSLVAEEATYRSAQAAIRVARSGLFPTVTGGASLAGTGTGERHGHRHRRAAASRPWFCLPPAYRGAPDLFGSMFAGPLRTAWTPRRPPPGTWKICAS